MSAVLDNMVSMNDLEEWRSIEGVPDCYEVSSLGRVRSWKNAARAGGEPRILKPGRNPKGYWFVALQMGNRVQKSLGIHRLVANAFLGDRPTGYVVRHMNGDQNDNRAANLSFGTIGQNNLDMVAHGTHVTASKTHCPSGHEYTEENTRRHQGRRHCRTCQVAHNLKSYAKRKARAS